MFLQVEDADCDASVIPLERVPSSPESKKASNNSNSSNSRLQQQGEAANGGSRVHF